MKSGPVIRILLVCTLVIVAGAAIVVIDRLPLRRLLALAGVSVTVSDLHATPTTTAIPATQQLTDLSRSVVVVQAFSGSSLVRSGSGVVASADGLILTTWATAPYGSGSFVYQVVTSRGVVLRARRVVSDPSGLVLLRTDTTDLPAASFADGVAVSIGQEVWTVAARVQTSRYSPVLVPARAVYEDISGTPVYSVDRTLIPLLAGAQVVTSRGSVVGIVRPSGGFSVIPAATVDTFIGQYLSSLSR